MLVERPTNCFVARDYFLCIPVALCSVHLFFVCILWNNSLRELLGGVLIAIPLVAPILVLVASYRLVGLALLAGFWCVGLLTQSLEWASNGNIPLRGVAGLVLWTVLLGCASLRILATHLTRRKW
jgi:hypothetical protein